MQNKLQIDSNDLIEFLKVIQLNAKHKNMKIGCCYIPEKLQSFFEEFNLKQFTGDSEIVFLDCPGAYCTHPKNEKINTFVDSFEILMDIAAKERGVIEQEWHEKDMWYVLKLEKFNVVFIEKGARI